MEKPLVSVIMPTYNQAQFVGEAVRSVLDQTYQNLELIIIDNYSDDGTEVVIHGQQDQRIKYYKLANHGIIAASRNYGIQHAVGEYVAFIDSDDLWYPEKIEKQIALMENDKDIGLVFTDFKIKAPNVRYEGKILGPKDRQIGGFIYDKLLYANFIISSSSCVRASVLKEVGGFDEGEDFRCAEDFDLWLRLARQCKAAYVPQVLGIYRMHEHNESAGEMRLQRAFAVIEKHVAQGWTNISKANRAKANFLIHIGWPLIGHNGKVARSHFTKAVTLNPWNFKALCVVFVGIFLSYFPFLNKILMRGNRDRKIANRLLNPQNL